MVKVCLKRRKTNNNDKRKVQNNLIEILKTKTNKQETKTKHQSEQAVNLGSSLEEANREEDKRKLVLFELCLASSQEMSPTWRTSSHVARRTALEA